MSAYIVDRNHIVYLVQCAMSVRLNRHHGSFSWVWDCNHETGECKRDTINTGDYNKAAEVANMLWMENIKSVSARYPHESSATLPGPCNENYVLEPKDIHILWDEIDPAQVLKACDCYAYQSCEHPTWNESQAFAFIELLRHAAWTALPGYDKANWGAPDTTQEKRDKYRVELRNKNAAAA